MYPHRISSDVTSARLAASIKSELILPVVIRAPLAPPSKVVALARAKLNR
jgi:hypothetical protein